MYKIVKVYTLYKPRWTSPEVYLDSKTKMYRVSFINMCPNVTCPRENFKG